MVLSQWISLSNHHFGILSLFSIYNNIKMAYDIQTLIPKHTLLSLRFKIVQSIKSNFSLNQSAHKKRCAKCDEQK